ncbi:unnamed protein product [Ceratitis capitata]|uniref:(Mediterranean fruit fly) hypothetical protein n=1 Tax=Ceratitis capitata TaxID=7213 RepID=A0A811VI54_CERCA|nr:unnamed protein product [Ceratitis capitata]
MARALCTLGSAHTFHYFTAKTIYYHNYKKNKHNNNCGGEIKVENKIDININKFSARFWRQQMVPKNNANSSDSIKSSTATLTPTAGYTNQ